MPDLAAPAAPAPAPAADPKQPLPIPAKEPEKKKEEAPAPEAAASPYDFDIDVKGQKQKVSFKDKQEIQAIIQKAIYADQMIKNATQATKGAEAMMERIKRAKDGDYSGIKEIFDDPEVGVDLKKVALSIVQDMMEDEKLSPEQRENRDLRLYKQRKEEEESKAKADAAARDKAERFKKGLAELRTTIIGELEKYPDIPKDQATFNNIIQYMQAAYRRFGKHLTVPQATALYAHQYWKGFLTTFSNLTDDQIRARFGDKTGQKVIERIQKLKLAELKGKTDPSKKTPSAGSSGDDKPKKTMSEKDFEKHFSQQLAGL